MGKKERERAFVENGSMLLEKLITTCNGMSTPIRNFSYEEINRATNNFDPSLVIFTDEFRWFKGFFEGRNVLIKKVGDYSFYGSGRVLNDVAISVMMSAHNNVLRLIGCCLETRIPSLVFEFAANGSLADRIHHVSADRTERQYEPMAWSSRLRIAREIAHAISYLHTAFSRPIIHRDIKMKNIFLDQHDVAKLTNFGWAISIPQGETHVEDVICGTLGYLCPDYVRTSKVTEKADVYGFGVVLFELLTGQNPHDFSRVDLDEDFNFAQRIRNKVAQGQCINEIVDPTILQGEGGACIEHQLQAVLDLAITCTENESGIRPSMVDVTKELRRFERSVS